MADATDRYRIRRFLKDHVHFFSASGLRHDSRVETGGKRRKGPGEDGGDLVCDLSHRLFAESYGRKVLLEPAIAHSYCGIRATRMGSKENMGLSRCMHSDRISLL